MKKLVRKLTAGALALCMVAGMGISSAFAADGVPKYYDDYMYSAKLTITPDEPLGALASGLFDTDVFINVNHKLGGEEGYNLHARTYVVNPIPANGQPNPIKELHLYYGNGENIFRPSKDSSDYTERTFDIDCPAYGIKAGDYLMATPLSFAMGDDSTGPKGHIKALEKGVNGYYLFTDGTRIDCTFQLSDFQLVWDHGKAPAAKPTETSQQSAQITASVEASKPTYSVKVPEAVAMGTLSKEQDNTTDYTVDVTAENLGSGKVVVSAPEAGELTSAENTLAYTNSFGTQETSVTASLAGQFTVTAVDAAAAAAGNYTGTANFTISYFAAK